jgi:hypothetical protein
MIPRVIKRAENSCMVESSGESVPPEAPREILEFTFVTTSRIANNPASIVRER